MRTGEEILVCCGDGWEYTCRVTAFGERDDYPSAILDSRRSRARSCPAGSALFQGLPKGDKMELIVQKAVELASREIVPVSRQALRCEAGRGKRARA